MLDVLPFSISCLCLPMHGHEHVPTNYNQRPGSRQQRRSSVLPEHVKPFKTTPIVQSSMHKHPCQGAFAAACTAHQCYSHFWHARGGCAHSGFSHLLPQHSTVTTTRGFI